MKENNGADNYKIIADDYFSFNLNDKTSLFNNSKNTRLELFENSKNDIINNLIEQLNDYQIKVRTLTEENLMLKKKLKESNINFIIPNNLKDTEEDTQSTTKNQRKLSNISVEKNKFVFKKAKEINYCNIYKEKKKNNN